MPPHKKRRKGIGGAPQPRSSSSALDDNGQVTSDFPSVGRYTYRPLLPARNSIRLVQLLPGAPGTDIHCRIIDYTIRHDRVSGLFEALSYVWGDPSSVQRIYVLEDSEKPESAQLRVAPMDITTNLFTAMQRLRDPVLPRTMWIDAICINQNDLEERAHQVSFMARIYSHALQVIVWLGDEANQSAGLLATVEDITQNLQYFRTIYEESSDRHESMSDESDESDDVERPGSHTRSRCRYCANTAVPGTLEHAFDQCNKLQVSLDAFLHRPWFHRVWVLQEVVAARHISVVCGAQELTGFAFSRGLECLCKFSLAARRTRNVGMIVVELMSWYSSTANRAIPNLLPDYLRRHSVSSRISPIGELLDKFHQHQASDQRDKIFALLGMGDMPCTPGPALEPNYNTCWASLYRLLVQKILGSSHVITTWENKEHALITASGRILGMVSDHVDGVKVDSATSSSHAHYHYPLWQAIWNEEPWCKAVDHGDYLFIADGAQAPSIIRLCDDHFDIIIISLPPPTRFCPQLELDMEWDHVVAIKSYDRRRIMLLWDWLPNCGQVAPRHRSIIMSVTSSADQHLDYHERILTCARILEASGRFEQLQQLLADKSPSDFPEKMQYPIQLLKELENHEEDYSWLICTVQKLRWTLWAMRHNAEGESFVQSALKFWKSKDARMCDLVDVILWARSCPFIYEPITTARGAMLMNFWGPCDEWVSAVVTGGWEHTLCHGRMYRRLVAMTIDLATSKLSCSHTRLLEYASGPNWWEFADELMPLVYGDSSLPALILVAAISDYKLAFTPEDFKTRCWKEVQLSEILSFSYLDIPTAYAALTFVMDIGWQRPLAGYNHVHEPIAHPTGSERRWPAFSQHMRGCVYIYGGDRTGMLEFLRTNSFFIKQYLEITDLAEYAESQETDKVIAGLRHAFPVRKPLDEGATETPRQTILRGIEDYQASWIT